MHYCFQADVLPVSDHDLTIFRTSVPKLQSIQNSRGSAVTKVTPTICSNFSICSAAARHFKKQQTNEIHTEFLLEKVIYTVFANYGKRNLSKEF